MFVGQTRFSLFQPGSTAWKATSGEFDGQRSYEDYLFNPERLDFRSKVFFEHTVPMLANAARSHRIRHIVSYSDNLPEPYLSRARDTASKYDFLIADERPAGVGATPWQELVDEHIGIDDVIGVYRLDDDDFLAWDFFDRMKPYLRHDFVGMRVSFALGFQGLRHEGAIRLPREVYAPMVGIGLTGIFRKLLAGQYEGPALTSHNRSDRVGPVINDASEAAFLWLRSPNQDTALGGSEEDRLEAFRQALNELPRIHPSLMLEKFPTLAGLVEFDAPTILLDREKELDNEIAFEFPAPLSQFMIEYVAKGNRGTQMRDYILTFELEVPGSATEGWLDTVDGITKRVEEEGATYYRYSRISAQQRTTAFSMRLPDGVRCRGIAFVKNRPDAVGGKIFSMKVYDDEGFK